MTTPEDPVSAILEPQIKAEAAKKLVPAIDTLYLRKELVLAILAKSSAPAEIVVSDAKILEAYLTEETAS